MDSRRTLRCAMVALWLGSLCGCGAPRAEGAPTPAEGARRGAETAATVGARPASCPEQAPAPEPLPGVDDAHRTLAYWLDTLGGRLDLDQVLLDDEGIRDHELALRARVDGRSVGQADLSVAPDAAELAEDLRDRLAFLHDRFESGGYVAADGSAITGDRLARYAPDRPPPALTPSVHVVLRSTPLRCGPERAGFFTPSLDPDFDRNNCSTLHAQEPVQVLARWDDEVIWVRSRYAMGFISTDAPLSPASDDDTLAALVHGPRVELLEAHDFAPLEGATTELRAGSLLPALDDGVLLGTRSGYETRPVDAHITRATSRPLTRRALFTEAFRWLGTPYGWGGNAGGHDCSRFLLDVFETFGLHLPRHSGRQALAGTFSVDVSDVENARDKLPILDAAERRGVVLLHFPGHIMLYLGRDAAGTPMVLHSFSEYVEPCAGTRGEDGRPLEILRRVDEVAVSDLSLGRGSSRGSFLERINRVVVVGMPPARDLAGVAAIRPSSPPPPPAVDRCEDSTDDAIFRMPRRPWPGTPLRVVATSTHDPGPVSLRLYDDEGHVVEAEEHVLVGPPYTRWVEIEHPEPGRYRAVLGDGRRIVACDRVGVARRRAPPPEPRPEDAPAWELSWHWERDTENLYSAFVEQLFREPIDGDVTFASLSEALRDPARNLLYDYLGQGEDGPAGAEGALELVPDCADLPYFLRAYFSWKLRLPFGFRHCNRGRQGRPPSCGELVTNLEPTAGAAEGEAFSRFLRRVGRGVHSASGRTPPSADETDYYPVPLSAEALTPGKVFADPYGHVLVVAGYRPQGLTTSGALIGADAQPDGTVGRRRFWRGSFLFTPDTSDVGAGFKAFRPLSFDEETGTLVAPTNDELRRGDPPYSTAQYEGSTDDFYERMEAVIDPRPVDARTRMMTLVDAFEEAIRRRVVSVDNGERYVSEHPGQTIEMPEGAAIFQTEGPWEDFSTPSRDMRLLISLDAVLGFPAQVRRHPQRFGVAEDAAAGTVAALDAQLARELGRRHFDYRRSDGSTQTLSLAEVASRAEAFEMAYDPNDCVERRWAAPEGSSEMSTCRRHAPAGQRARMRQYRPWFQRRERPAAD